MILVDSSAWVEYDRGTESRVHVRLRELISSDGEIATTEPVVMEVLIGARTSSRERELRKLLDRFFLLEFDVASDFERATTIYRHCRQVGITPRGLLDCMIAAVAGRRNASILSHDLDMARLAPVAQIQLDPASLTA